MTTPSIIPPPPQASTLGGKLLALGGLAVSAAYLANLGAGFIGEIPDILPGIGNLDEVFFSGLLIMSLHRLGIPVIPGLASVKRPPRLPGPDRE